jgi:capsular exopolysaccharide synthesis family protein
MSRNFELMQQIGQDFQAGAVPKTSAVFPKTQETRSKHGVRVDLGQMAREETLRLVQRVFLSQPDKGPRVVVFAGVDKGSGCSQICTLVSETLSSNIQGSICIVDANFRSPTLPGMFGTTNHHGLTDALLHEGPIRSFVKPLRTDTFCLLSSGSLAADSPNLLNSERLKFRFEELRKEFDYVLIDAPPLTQFSDAIALGRVTDGFVLVIEANSTRKEAAVKVMGNLHAAAIEVLGAVLNKRTFPIPQSLYDRL